MSVITIVCHTYSYDLLDSHGTILAAGVATRQDAEDRRRELVTRPYFHLSDQTLVQRYDAEARERWTDQDDALQSSGRMDDMHAELVARDLDWDDPHYFA